jgi:hypothetical protein
LARENDEYPAWNVGTELKPLQIPQPEGMQLAYCKILLCDCDGDHARLIAVRKICTERQREASLELGNETDEVWSRAVDLCDQALLMIEGAAAASDDKARRLLIAACKFGNSKYTARDLTETLRELGATRAEVPTSEMLVSWAFPWL